MKISFTVTSKDPEVRALEVINAVVSVLRPSQASRVMKYIVSRYGPQWEDFSKKPSP